MVLNKSKRVIALGFFDGVHRGHGALLERVVEKSRELGAVASAFTFDRSPTAAITGQVVPLLSSVEDRAWLMRTCYGIQEVIVSSFDGMMRMDWRDFITQYLVKELGVVHVVAGHDFHFGYMGKGNPQRLQETCAQLGIGCDIIGKVELEDITISSTYIRTLIQKGDMERAARFLGHPHTLSGPVVHGKGLGHGFGFPTINLGVSPDKQLPRYGVYGALARVGQQVYRAVCNVGVRPTVNGESPSVEAFLLDFQGDVYGERASLALLDFYRPEMRFSSTQALSAQVARDAARARRELPKPF